MKNQSVVVAQVTEFFIGCTRAMALCAEDARQQSMVARFRQQIERRIEKSFIPRPITALRNLDDVTDMKLAKDFRHFAHQLPWRDSPRTQDGGTEIGLFDLADVLDLGAELGSGIAAGLIYVDCHQAYPEHNHPPQEMYFLISGTAHWRFGGNRDYQKLTAGNVIYNYPWNFHGVKAAATPTLALFLQTT